MVTAANRQPIQNEVSPIKVTERFPQETGRSYAYRIIRENIISTELAPGSLVSEKELAQQLNLSRTPVRESLIDLAQVGIVEVFPQRGSRISFINCEMVEEAQFARFALEHAACHRLCTAETLPDLSVLTRNIRAQQVVLAEGDSAAFLKLDDEFHQSLFQLAGLSHIFQLISSFGIHFDRMRSLSLGVADVNQLVADHIELAGDLAAQEERSLNQVLERHLSRYKIDEEAIRRAHPTFFPEEDR